MFYEMICLDGRFGVWKELYYFASHAEVTVQNAMTNRIPDKLRLMLDDRESVILEVRKIPFLKWVWLKYIAYTMRGAARRINWEVEKI